MTGAGSAQSGDAMRIREEAADWVLRLTFSPDGTAVAFLLRRPNPIDNSYCTGLVAVDLNDPDDVRLLDVVREKVEELPEWRGPFLDPEPPNLLPPLWSPDGASILFPRREDRIVNLWVVPAGGGDPKQVTRSPVRIESFAWAENGRSIVFSSRPQIVDLLQGIEDEARSGWRYDNRFQPNRGARPFIEDLPPLEHSRIELNSKSLLPASVAEVAQLEMRTRHGPGSSSPAWRAISPAGHKAEIYRPDPDRPWIPTRLRLTKDNSLPECPAEACVDLEGVWWAGNGTELFFLRREGHARRDLAMYRWTPGEGAAKRQFATTDELMGCQTLAADFICIHSAATSPPRLVRVDPRTGARETVFDPNPQTAGWRFGRVERLDWTTASGMEVFGDLVLPPDYSPGEKLPLVFVGYTSRGFLKGGVGDEYPIHAFATRGYAVMSYHASPFYGVRYNPANVAELNALNRHNWGEYRDFQTSMERVVEILDGRGIIDVQRVGLTGFSAGTRLGRWPALHSNLFAAASFSHCCANSTDLSLLGFDGHARWLSYGRAPISAGDVESRRLPSLHLEPNQLDIPTLFQMSDSEYVWAIEAITALRQELGKPVDLYVFRNEGHTKAQPAHRLSVYERNLDWFDFWLRGVENQTPGRPSEYQQWNTWRTERRNPQSVGSTAR